MPGAQARNTQPQMDDKAVLPKTSLASLKHWGDLTEDVKQAGMPRDYALHCGWGRLLFAQTFEDQIALTETLKEEKKGQRDLALYIRDPHVALSRAPQDVFLDPSHTFRLDLVHAGIAPLPGNGFVIRPMRVEADYKQVRKIYKSRKMIAPKQSFYEKNMPSDILSFYVAADKRSGEIIGTVMGVDHAAGFNDIDNGSSLWALAVDPQAQYPGIGEALTRFLAMQYKAAGRSFMDLSVMHDNEQAVALYKKLGFEQIPVYCLKKKQNPLNEKLYTGPKSDDGLNVYAQILVDEARRRGIGTEILDAEGGFYALTYGGRRIVCRESLTELTSAVAMSRCDDKSVTRRVLKGAGLSVPDQMTMGSHNDAMEFLEKHGRIVVKPARGEQGAGISVDLDSWEEVEKAIKVAKAVNDKVILEQFVAGHDTRIVVIDGKTVVAAIRKPAHICGDGVHTITDLIKKQSRRRMAASGGKVKSRLARKPGAVYVRPDMV